MNALRELIEARKSELRVDFEETLKNAGAKDGLIRALSYSLGRLEARKPLRDIPFLSPLISAMLGKGHLAAYPVLVTVDSNKKLSISKNLDSSPESLKQAFANDPLAQKSPNKTKANNAVKSTGNIWTKKVRLKGGLKARLKILKQGMKDQYSITVVVKKAAADKDAADKAKAAKAKAAGAKAAKAAAKKAAQATKTTETPAEAGAEAAAAAFNKNLGQGYLELKHYDVHDPENDGNWRIKQGRLRRAVLRPTDPGKSTKFGKDLTTPPDVVNPKRWEDIWRGKPSWTFNVGKNNLPIGPGAPKLRGSDDDPAETPSEKMWRDFVAGIREETKLFDLITNGKAPDYSTFKDLYNWLFKNKTQGINTTRLAVYLANAVGRLLKDYSVVSDPHDVQFINGGKTLMVTVPDGPFELKPDAPVWLGTNHGREEKLNEILETFGKKIEIVGRVIKPGMPEFARHPGKIGDRISISPERNLSSFYTGKLKWDDNKGEVKKAIFLYMNAIKTGKGLDALKKNLDRIDLNEKFFLGSVIEGREAILKRFYDAQTPRKKTGSIQSLIRLWRAVRDVVSNINYLYTTISNDDLREQFEKKGQVYNKYKDEAIKKLNSVLSLSKVDGDEGKALATAVNATKLGEDEEWENIVRYDITRN